jgi:hypothetical protein
VTVAILPAGTTLDELGRVPGLSPGMMSAGIGRVSAEQTYTDISAGARESPPSDAVPGLLALTLADAGIPESAVRTVHVSVGEAAAMATAMRNDDLLIAFGAPPPAKNEGLPIGVAGRGFDGNLTSDSTRTTGYVLDTDIAPTILKRLGVAIPNEMNGEPIRSEGAVDLGAVEDRAARMKAIPERRGPVVIGSLAAWIALAVAVALVAPRLRRRALGWLGLTIAYLPLVLLVGAALEPSAPIEGVITGLGAAVLAAATLALVPGWWALAVACAATSLAYAIDVIAGSPLTTLSLLGPNPIYGARFFGIGNELEALLCVLVPAGVAAGLTGWGSGGNRHVATAAFLGAAALAAIVFGAGRFGADVGAAIVFPVGAVAAAVSLTPESSSSRPRNRRRRVGAALIAAPLIALFFLALIDLVSGGNAHLTRSVLDAGGASDLADAAERRLRLSAHDFRQAAGDPLFWVIVAGIALAATRWRRIDALVRPAPAVRAALIGACAAVAVGVLVNDSGATFLSVGAIALAAFGAYAWSQMPHAGGEPHER